MLRILHLADIHLGGGLLHGRLNPLTGRNTRLEDFITALNRCIDQALSEPVDLVLFGGDAFPTATPEPAHQEEFARQFMRLAQAQIPVVFLVGNHDQYNRGGGGASLNIYTALEVPGFIVGSTLTTHRISTRAGVVQVVTLPWLHRSAFLTKEATRGLTLEEVDQLMVERLRVILEGEARKLDPELPTILMAHVMVETATWGVERNLAVGRGFTVPVDLLARPEFSYVALGHVHRHQFLHLDPPVVYSGSIERVDFSEEKEEKGFMRVDLVKEGSYRAECRFVPLPARPFCTVKIDASTSEHPQETILAALRRVKVTDAVVRVIYQIHAHQNDSLDLAPIRQALEPAFSYQLVPQMTSQLAQPRIPTLGESATLDPMAALHQYLDNQDHLKALKDDLLKAACTLMDDSTDLTLDQQPPRPGQLRLL
ncbi:exonuclease subunit SbcD [Anthocerotibacter panamensis]|uniref:exonuclease subunit SbcD n=1 Tax=Anthocerotibacter panamensis TaxID=2857077 RepID=UPI001C403BE7|nr:exonuclease subunit SbcD [Anthocerotibacter panamensis]